MHRKEAAPPKEYTGSLDPVASSFAAAAFLTAGFICLPALIGLSRLFSRIEFYGHGFFIPLVSAYLAYGQRRAIVRALRRPSPGRFGAPLVFIAAGFELLMVVGQVDFLAGVGVAILLGATAYAVGGIQLLRPLALPLGFLVLMVPPPGFVTQNLLIQLKLLVTQAAVLLLQSMSVPVLAEGNRIVTPEHTLFVVDACSGLTSMVTMLPIACVVAYFQAQGVWRRGAVIASVIPLALLANLVRVVGTVLLVSKIGPVAAQGILHESFGVATYAVGTMALLGVARAIR